MTTKYDIGDRVHVTYTVKLDGALTDPPIVMLLVRRPDNSEHVSIYGEVGQPYPISRDSAGVYSADIPLTASGGWFRRWVVFDELGSPLDAFESRMSVGGSAFEAPLPEAT